MESLSARLNRILPTAWLKLSLLIHLGALVGVVAAWRLWPWSLGVIAANHLLLTLGGLLPRSRLLGPNWTRLPGGQACVALTIDDGPDPEVTPAVLDLLRQNNVRATFFCIGERIARHPELARRIAREGHEIGNHTEHHRYVFSLFGPTAVRREVAQAQASIHSICQVIPRFFRAPAGLRNPFLQPCLSELNLQLASWTRRGYDTVNADSDGVLKRLTCNLTAGDILLLHDGRAARTADGTPVILAVLPKLLPQLARQRLRCVTLSDGVSGGE
ncbi:MAG TPA: polysaccharide deacetylase family protein [Steroidobacteraceae bacterium]|nr:polysaccharide deacetylase family protein [Steroidobacteraceae bacterium]